jgi:hypothetical protein
MLIFFKTIVVAIIQKIISVKKLAKAEKINTIVNTL